jgi:cell division transport system permease protein
MINHVSYTLREAFRALGQTKRMVVLSVTTMSLSMLIFGIFLLTTVNVHQAVRRLQEKVEIEIFLSDAISPEERAGLTATLQGLDQVQEAVYISKEDALREADIDTAYISAVGSNPLPASIRVRLREGYRSAGDIDTIIERIGQAGGIEEIVSGRQWAHQLDRYLFILLCVTAVIGIIFGLASILVNANTIQLSIFTRRETITIMQLVGASDGLIRGPFILEGILQGVTAGLLTVAGLAGLYWGFRQHLPWLLSIGPLPLGGFIIAGGLLGGFGSGYAVNRSLKTISLF